MAAILNKTELKNLSLKFTGLPRKYQVKIIYFFELLIQVIC